MTKTSASGKINRSLWNWFECSSTLFDWWAWCAVGFVFCCLFVFRFLGGAKLFVRLSLSLAVFRLIAEPFVAATCSIRFGRLKKRKCDVVRSVCVYVVRRGRAGCACLCVGIECSGKSEKRQHIRLSKWHFATKPTSNISIGHARFLS